MSPEAQFWWNWWVSFATAFGTIAVAVVAVFAEPIRRLFAFPSLQISLSERPGEGTKADTKAIATVNGKLQERVTVSRWRHIKVENPRRHFAEATRLPTKCSILYRQFDHPYAHFWEWIGELPLSWKDQVVKLPAITMGQPDEADLCKKGSHSS